MAELFDVMNRLEGAMTFHRERHAVLAGNVANLDTPGYRPADLERVPSLPGSVTLEQTAAGHLAAPGDSAARVVTFDDGGALSGPDGNAVSLERELAKVDANRVRYATSTELVSRRAALLKYAASDGG